MFIAFRGMSSWDLESLISSTTLNYSYHLEPKSHFVHVILTLELPLALRLKVVHLIDNSKLFITSIDLSS